MKHMNYRIKNFKQLWFLFILLALLSLVAGMANQVLARSPATLKTLDRTLEPVIIRGTDVPDLIGAPVDQLLVYTYTNSGWGGQIPFQVDEVTASGLYTISENGLLDANDEIVLMSSDLGDQAPIPLSLQTLWPFSGPIIEIEVADSLDTGKKGWAYLAQSDDIPASFSDDYAGYITGTQQISASAYLLGLSTSHLGLDDLELNGSGNDILDRTKLQIVVDSILGEITATEDTLGVPAGSEPKLVKDGPVRVIVERPLRSEALGVDLTSTYFGYGALLEGIAAFSLAPPAGISVESVRTSLDFNSAVSSSTFYNANAPGGVIVDGNPDAGVDAGLSNWFQLSHTTGRFIQVTDPAALSANPATYYKDEDTIDSSDTGDQQSYGESGYLFEDDINLMSTLRSLFFVLPPAVGGPDNVGNIFEQYYFNPLTIETTAFIPISSVAIIGAPAGITNTAYLFTAEVSPSNATSPMTYTWQATDYTTTTESSGSQTFTWVTTGTKSITLTAGNGGLITTDTHTINIISGEGLRIYLPMILKTPDM